MRKLRLSTVGAAVAAALLLAACGSGTQVTGVIPPPPGTATSASAAELGELVAPAPDGFEAVGAPFGPVDLNGFLRSFAGQAEAEQLAFIRSQFVRGLSRGWSDAAGTMLSVAVLEFREDRGASWFVENELAIAGVDTGPVAGIEGAFRASYVVHAADGPARYHEVFFTRGPRLFLVFSVHRDPAATPDLVVDFARTQAAVAR